MKAKDKRYTRRVYKSARKTTTQKVLEREKEKHSESYLNMIERAKRKKWSEVK